MTDDQTGQQVPVWINALERRLRELESQSTTLVKIRKVLDGTEWNTDTLDEIATLMKDKGWTIRSPEEMIEVWMFPATIYMKVEIVNENADEYGDLTEAEDSNPADRIVSVTVAPAMGTDFNLFSGADEFDRDHDQLDRMLGEYLERNSVEDLENPHKDSQGKAYRHLLRWEG